MHRIRITLLSALVMTLTLACSDEATNSTGTKNNSNTIPTNNSDACGVAECPAGNPLCNTSTMSCVECMQDSHCGLAEPACDADGECRECINDSYCTGTRSVCNLRERECQAPCATNNDCGDNTPFCNTESGRCVECETTQNCDNNETCNAQGVCVECSANADCGGEDPICRTEVGRCVECAAASDCANSAPCVDFECVECIDDSNCPVAAPLCDRENRCELCDREDNRGCAAPTPFCVDGNACAECVDDEHCGDNMKCDNGTCRPD
jgi:Cys-rich repeat protein